MAEFYSWAYHSYIVETWNICQLNSVGQFRNFVKRVSRCIRKSLTAGSALTIKCLFSLDYYPCTLSMGFSQAAWFDTWKFLFYSILFYFILFYCSLFHSILFYSILFYSIPLKYKSTSVLSRILLSDWLLYSLSALWSIQFNSILFYSILNRYIILQILKSTARYCSFWTISLGRISTIFIKVTWQCCATLFACNWMFSQYIFQPPCWKLKDSLIANTTHLRFLFIRRPHSHKITAHKRSF